MFLRKSTTVKYLLAAVAGAALYSEWFVYVIQPWYWQGLECRGRDPSCTKILFVGDPQIQGDLAVPPPLSYLFNWDSDRYLKSTFAVVLNHFKPQVVVYMGDITDEGSISTLAQFHGYVKRISNIFDINYPVVQIWLPGDNDIGGEHEPVKKDKVEEFERIFHQPPVIMYKNISFYKVNAITHDYPKRMEENNSNFRIVVSHYPVTLRHMFSSKVKKEIQPNVFFCAHEHESKYVKQNNEFSHRETHMLEYGSNILEVPFDGETMYEIYVPTCSYRMGTDKIGYGAAILEKESPQLKYTVFWSPTRFLYLYFYLAILIFLCAYILLFCTGKLFLKFHTTKIYSYDRQPLLQRI